MCLKALQKAKIFNCPNKRMAGHELNRLRTNLSLSEDVLADKMKDWSWYRSKVRRFENAISFELDPIEMQDLLKALSATSL